MRYLLTYLLFLAGSVNAFSQAIDTLPHMVVKRIEHVESPISQAIVALPDFLVSGIYCPAPSPDTITLQTLTVTESAKYKSDVQLPFTDLKYQQGKRLSDALGEFSSVYVKSYGNGQLASLAVRGTSASQTEIQWNGIKLNAPTLGQVDLSLFSLGMQDELLLMRTPTKGAIGGTLQMRNEVSFDTGIAFSGALRYGSFKTFQSFAGLQYGTGKFSGATKFSYLTSANNFKFRDDFKAGHPYREQTNAQVKLLSFMQQFNARINNKNELSFYLWLTEADRQIPPVTSKPDSREKQLDESLRAMANWRGTYKNLYLTFTTAYLYDKLQYINPEALLNSTTRTKVLRNLFTARYQLLNIGLFLNAEVNYDYEQATVPAYNANRVRNTEGIKLYANYFVKHLLLSIGFRQDVVNKEASPFSPQLKISYYIRKKKHDIDATLSASRSFRFPTFNDLYWVPGGNPNLKREQSWNGELSVGYRYNKLVYITASGFYMYVNDWIQWVPQGADWSAVNYKRVLSRGFEAAINVTNTNVIGKKLKVDVNVSYSFTKTTNLDAASAFDQSEGKQLIYVPLHSVAAGLQLQYRRFYVRATGNYFSQLFISTDNSQFLDGYFICNVEAGKDFKFKGQEVGLSFRVNNVANANYQSVAQRPMPGRGFEGIIRFKFSK